MFFSNRSGFKGLTGVSALGVALVCGEPRVLPDLLDRVVCFGPLDDLEYELIVVMDSNHLFLSDIPVQSHVAVGE